MIANYRPIFKKKEVVIKLPEKSDTDLGGEYRMEVAKVVYTGKEAQNYKPGDNIMYLHARGMEKNRTIIVDGEELMIIESEERVLCQVEYDV